MYIQYYYKIKDKMRLFLDLYDIHFQLRKSNNISMYHYINKYKYNDIIKIFSLQNEYLNSVIISPFSYLIKLLLIRSFYIFI